MMNTVSIPYPFLWTDDRPLYGPFDRRRRPRIQAAIAVKEESRFEPALCSDEHPVPTMHWAMAIDANGQFSLRAEWT